MSSIPSVFWYVFVEHSGSIGKALDWESRDSPPPVESLYSILEQGALFAAKHWFNLRRQELF